MLSDPRDRWSQASEQWRIPGAERDAAMANRRMAERVLVDLEVDYGSDGTFLFAYARNISTLGIFLRTFDPEPRGTRLNLRFVVPGSGRRLQVEGVVRWVNTHRPGDIDSLNPGMGVEFVCLDDEQRSEIVDLIRLIAYLPDEDRARHLQG